MKMNRINYKMFWLIVGLSFGFLVGCEKNKEKSLEKGQGIICDFENIKVWGISPERGFNLSLSSVYVTEGKKSLKVVYPISKWPSINTKKLSHDWRNYDFLTFDVYNPENEKVNFVVRLDDNKKKRINIDYPLVHGWNHVKIPKNKIDRGIDANNITFVVLFLNKPSKRITLYFDNMRLEKEQMTEGLRDKGYDSLSSSGRGTNSKPHLTQINTDGKEQMNGDKGFNFNNKTTVYTEVKKDLEIEERFEPIIIKNNLSKKGEIRVPVVKFINKEVKDVLVSNGIPFAPGQLFSEKDFAVLNDNGDEIPIAKKVLARWSYDNSIRSILVQFPLVIKEKYERVIIQWGGPSKTKELELKVVDWIIPEAVIALPASWLCQSLVLGEQLPVEYGKINRHPLKKYDQNIKKYYPRMRDFMLTGNIVKDSYYDTAHVFYQLYVRSGDEGIFKSARREAVHYRDEFIVQNGASRGRPVSRGKSRYIYMQAMVDDYLLTGDEKSLKIAGYMAKYLKNNYDPQNAFFPGNAKHFWTEREAAFPFLGVITYYDLVGDKEYLDYASQIMKNLYKTQLQWPQRGGFIHNLYSHDIEEGCRPDEYGGSPFMTGLLLEAIVKYHKLTGSNIAEDSIFRTLDWLIKEALVWGGKSFVYLTCDNSRNKGHPDLNLLVSHAFGYGYKISGYRRKDYLEVGGKIFEEGVLKAYLNDRKHFNQNYRSSGHFLAYIESENQK